MIQKKVDVTITRKRNTIKIDNHEGMTWEIKVRHPGETDISTASAIGHAFANMMAATIGSQFYHTNEKFYHFSIQLSAYS